MDTMTLLQELIRRSCEASALAVKYDNIALAANAVPGGEAAAEAASNQHSEQYWLADALEAAIERIQAEENNNEK